MAAAGSTLRTLDRGLDVLVAISERDGTATARELSKTLGVSRSTTYQLLRTLLETGFATRGSEGRYALGPAVERLAGRLHTPPSTPQALIAALDGLFQDVGETSYLAGWWLSKICIQAVREGSQSLRVAQLGSGYDCHPHARASCRAILAFLDEDAVTAYMASCDWQPLTPNTKTTLEDLMADLVVCRERGYAVDHEEFLLGVTCVAAPILNAEGFPAYCLSVSVPTVRAQATLSGLIDRVRKAAEKASSASGGAIRSEAEKATVPSGMEALGT